MYTDAVLDADGSEIPEGLARCRRHLADRAARPATAPGRCATAAPARSTSSSRRCTAPEEVAFTDDAVRPRRGDARAAAQHAEDGHHGRGAAHLGQPQGLHRAPRSDRVVFINTGFLDRTGDEIHTSMEAGPMIRKSDMQHTAVDQGLRGPERRYRPGLRPARQGADRQGHVGGARPDGRHAGAEDRPSAGRRQHRLGALAHRRHAARAALPPGRRARRGRPSSASRPRAPLCDLLTIPLADRPNWSPDDVQQELDNNCQGILGYVVRWIDQGVGCSKVPDIHDVGLMEDRATLAHLQPAHRQLAASRHRRRRRR